MEAGLWRGSLLWVCLIICCGLVARQIKSVLDDRRFRIFHSLEVQYILRFDEYEFFVKSI